MDIIYIIIIIILFMHIVMMRDNFIQYNSNNLLQISEYLS